MNIVLTVQKMLYMFVYIYCTLVYVLCMYAAYAYSYAFCLHNADSPIVACASVAMRKELCHGYSHEIGFVRE